MQKALNHSIYIFLPLLLISLVYLIYANTTVWYDEAYTVAMMQHSLLDIIRITAADVHPPLYYLMLKVFTKVFGSSFISLRIFSALGVFATFLIGWTTVKRLFGKQTFIYFTLLLCLLPVTQYLGIEIRMYSWSLFFVLGTSLYAYEAYKDNTRSAFIKLTLYTIAAIYIHYFALITCVILYTIYLLLFLKNKKSEVLPFVYASLGVILAYSIWLPTFVSQSLSVKKDFWIEKLTFKDLLLFSYYFFSPKEPSHPYMIFSKTTMSVALSLTLILCIIIGFILIKDNIQNKKKNVVKIFMWIPTLTMVITLIISFTIRPINIARYMNCFLGSLMIGLAILLTELSKTKYKILVVSLFSIFALLSIARFLSEKTYYKMKKQERNDMNSYLSRNDIETKNIVSFYESYHYMAELFAEIPTYQYKVISSETNKTYEPFDFKNIKSQPKDSIFYLLKTETDSRSLTSNYRKIDSIKTEKFKIILIKQINQSK